MSSARPSTSSASSTSPHAKASRPRATSASAQAAALAHSEADPDLVSFRLRQLEPLIGWTIGAYTLWLAVFVLPGSLNTWAGALFAACTGAWARAFPARRQGRLALRGALLLAGALVMHTSADALGPAGPLFFWPLAVVASYALFLRARWSVLLGLLALAEFTTACMLNPSAEPWQTLIALGGALVAFPLLAGLLGRSLRGADAQLEATMLDRQTDLYNEAGFLFHGQALFDQCRARRQPLTMVLLDASDLMDVQEMLGRKTADRMLRHAARGVLAGLPPEGIGARLSQMEIGLLLPNMTAARADSLIRGQLGDPPAVTFTERDRKVRIVLDMVAMEAQPDMVDVDAHYERLYRRLRRLRRAAPASSGIDSPDSVLNSTLEMDSFMPDLAREVSATLPMPIAERR